MEKKPYLIKEADRAILLALARFHYLTAAQANRVLYPTNADENRYAQRLLKRLVDAGYVLRLRALPAPLIGREAHVFTLAGNGRKYLQACGVPVEPYFRPSEEKRTTENSPFMRHRLAAIDVMIAVDTLCREDSRVVCPQMYSERELKRNALRVDVPPNPAGYGGGTVAVIPDAWFQLDVAGKEVSSIALELDRSSEDQKVWRQKVAAYVVWAEGPYKQAFETDNLTIAVACPSETRRTQLLDWTMRELRARGLAEFGELFLFTAASPVDLPVQEFFFGNVWRQADTREAVSLLVAPPVPNEKGVVYRSV